MGDSIEKYSLEKLRVSLDSIECDENYAVNFIDELLKGAYYLRGSDVHIECLADRVNMKLRLDGVLYPIVTIDEKFKENIVSRLKYLAKLAVYQRTLPQDGRLQFEGNGATVSFRISTLPTIYGEKVVVRLPEIDKAIFDIHSLGIPEKIKKELINIVKRRQGLLLLTGPSSSGKTTTIYSLLKYLYEVNGEKINIATIEDPVEQSLGFMSQTQVNPVQGLTIAVGLKSILRQDPDIIMIGEMRDVETTSTAIQASLAGHLVISTIHSNQAVGVFLRLLHMEIEPFLVASAIQGVLSQRLVRKLCPHCKKETKVPDTIVAQYNTLDGVPIFEKVGCEKCNLTGFIGRTGIFEFISITNDLEEMILSKAPVSEFSRYVEESKISTLIDDGISKVIDGITSLEEVMRVCGLLVE